MKTSQKAVALILLPILCGSAAAQTEIKLSPKHTLLFEDEFERNETQEIKDELGNGWGTNSDKRAGGNKQIDLGDGSMHIVRHETADHAVSVTHPAKFRDCRVELRFRLGNAKDDLGIDFADMKCKEVHAGHICKIYFRPIGIEMLDFKYGRMNKPYRDAARAGKATKAQKEAVKQYEKKFNSPISLNDWHTAVVTISGNKMEVELDGKTIGSFSSPGMGYPQKDMIRFSARREAWIDDVRMYDVQSE